ncbi:DUF222 domain-containing protein [Frankia sp. AgB1.9]|uniref:DUF222 domain-containing protein n=1 Tax=Frankia sp. AgB1.9 TaxID=1836968 RepID=UPI001931EDF8|nr:DUF222 domain-containing protein [Frankia sp. AgB1.9]MBL7551834.1 DUF222 domain-containing protein [Frankia sp. AgB1.9]
MDQEERDSLAALRRALAAIEPTALPPEAAAELIGQLVGVVAAAQAALVRAVGAAAGSRARTAAAGPRSAGDAAQPAGWLAQRTRLTWAAAAALLVAARALSALPVLADAFRRGDVGLDHVLALAIPVASAPRLVALAGPAAAELTALARRADPGQVRAAVDRWLRDVDPRGVAGDAEAARRARSLSLLTVPAGAAGGPDGQVTICGTVPVDDARTLLDALRLAARVAAGPGDARNPAQRRADALLVMARCYRAVTDLTTAARSG